MTWGVSGEFHFSKPRMGVIDGKIAVLYFFASCSVLTTQQFARLDRATNTLSKHHAAAHSFLVLCLFSPGFRQLFWVLPD